MKTREKIMVVGILAVFLTTVSANADLVAHWEFEDGGGTTAQDSSVNGNDGTLVNGPAWTSGKIDGGLSFDGTDDYVDVSDNPSLRFGQHDSFTIAFWAKPLLVSPDNGFVVSKMRTSGKSGVFGYQVYWSPLGQWVFLVDKAGYSQTYLYTSENSAPEDNWYHVAAVYDNKDMKIYLNGQFEVQTTFSYDASDTPDKNLAIGVRSFDTTLEQYFKGKLDDIRIYNQALNANEVAALVPEPTTVLILGLGALMLRRKRRFTPPGNLSGNFLCCVLYYTPCQTKKRCLSDKDICAV